MHELAHEHDGHHLEGLGQHHHREGHELQRLVLAPRRQHVRNRREGVLPQGRGVPRDLEVVHERPGQQQASEAIHEDQAVAVLEELAIISLCQDTLLYQTPDGERYDESGGADE